MGAVPRHRRRCGDNDALVLDLLREANGPLSAYDIAGQAAAHGDPIVPNQVYRTLARLIDDGRVLRIETLSAYVVRQSRADVCLICSDCHAVELVEMPDLRQRLADAVRKRRFDLSDGLIETQGRCGECRVAAPAQPASSALTGRPALPRP